MILAIDAGNTNITLGCIENGTILNIERIQTHPKATSIEYAIRIRAVLEFHDITPDQLEGSIIASVVPPVTGSLAAAVKTITGLKSMIVGPGIKTGLNVRIDDPGTLAGDLVVGSVAAMTYYGTPVIIMDLDTATTMVVVDRDGCYRGGAIIPGVMLSYEALASGTSLLPDIYISAPKKVIGTNTVDAMRSGAVFSTASAIDGMIDRMEAELGYECHLVATGDLAKSIIPHCKRKIICDDDLILKGLWALYERNRK